MTVSIVLILYILTGLGFIAYLFSKIKAILFPLRFLYGVCIAVHSLFILTLWQASGRLPIATPSQGLNALILFSSLVFMPFVMKRRTTVLAAFFLPVASCVLAFIAPSLQAVPDALMSSYRYFHPLHTISVITGEAFFVMAAVVSVVYLIHERNIRNGSIHTTISALPPLTVLDSILYSSLSYGFIAITMGMILGGLWASSAGLKFGHIAPKVITGAITWLVFALSLHQRFAIGWKGRRTAIITLIGFALMALFFVLVNLAFPYSHGIRLI